MSRKQSRTTRETSKFQCHGFLPQLFRSSVFLQNIGRSYFYKLEYRQADCSKQSTHSAKKWIRVGELNNKVGQKGERGIRAWMTGTSTENERVTKPWIKTCTRYREYLSCLVYLKESERHQAVWPVRSLPNPISFGKLMSTCPTTPELGKMNNMRESKNADR